MNSRASTEVRKSPQSVKSLENLRQRVERLLSPNARRRISPAQIQLDLLDTFRPEESISSPTKNIGEFLGFLADSLPDGDVYLFGGVLRDLALLGARGFSSDVDLVVEGDWLECVRYLDHLRARRNKFGGYRLKISGWDVDIWNARETWAIRQGLVDYESILSLTSTTVLNWDAILMNWKTKNFVCRHDYLEQVQSRTLDIVLESNPDPLGMNVRVLRHLCSKDAKSLTSRAIVYLADSTAEFSLQELLNREVRSYGRSIIEPQVYRFFANIKANEMLDLRERIEISEETTRREFGALPEIELTSSMCRGRG